MQQSTPQPSSHAVYNARQYFAELSGKMDEMNSKMTQLTNIVLQLSKENAQLGNRVFDQVTQL